MAADNNMDLERSMGRLEGKLDSIVNIVADLKGAFETMEKGRLSRLEVAFNTLQTEIAVKSKNTTIVWSAVISVATSVAAAVVIHLLVK